MSKLPINGHNTHRRRRTEGGREGDEKKRKWEYRAGNRRRNTDEGRGEAVRWREIRWREFKSDKKI